MIDQTENLVRNDLGPPTTCPMCGGSHSKPFFDLREMPVSIGCQWPSAQQARTCAKGDINLTLCPQTGFIWNSAFDATAFEYDTRYDNSLDHSPLFRRYAGDLARRLVETYDLHSKDIIEIGCGKGHFLSLLCQAGDNRGFGFDPSYEKSRMEARTEIGISIIADYFSEKYASISGDLICCRHVLEHIANPVQFLATVRRAIRSRSNAIVYFEVPNVRFILNRHSVWDIIYEHCNYFSIESLGSVFAKCGFEILRLESTYGDQFLGIEARPSQPSENSAPPSEWGDFDELRRSVVGFASTAQSRFQEWRDRLAGFRTAARKAVIWGAGAKAVGFLNMLQIGDEVPYAVDINPYKSGNHLAGTGQRIVPPEFLRVFRPDAVILMNKIYEEEVAAQLAMLHVDAEIVHA